MEDGMYKKILVPLDGSKTAEGVLPHARALAYSEGAEIIILNVAANPAMEFAFSDPSIAEHAVQEQESFSKKYTAEIERQLKADGFKVYTIMREGAAAEVILKVADETKADVIAMSTHGRTGPARWLLGSVADRVVRNSRVPVMMVRAKP
jgi:nucleotide-binding universal stress UspA family protein